MFVTLRVTFVGHLQERMTLWNSLAMFLLLQGSICFSFLLHHIAFAVMLIYSYSFCSIVYTVRNNCFSVHWLLYQSLIENQIAEELHRYDMIIIFSFFLFFLFSQTVHPSRQSAFASPIQASLFFTVP